MLFPRVGPPCSAASGGISASIASAETLEKQQCISKSVVVPWQLVLRIQHYLEGKDLCFLGLNYSR